VLLQGAAAQNASMLTVTEASRRLGITKDLTYRLVQAGTLPATKVDGRWYITEQAVEDRLRRVVARKRKQEALRNERDRRVAAVRERFS
jgi:excisionase family DNA binding protein